MTPCYAYLTDKSQIKSLLQTPKGRGVSLFYSIPAKVTRPLSEDEQHLLNIGNLVCFMGADRIIQLGNARNVPLAWRMLPFTTFLAEMAKDKPEAAPKTISHPLIDPGLRWDILKTYLLAQGEGNDLYSLTATQPQSLDDICLQLAPEEPKLSSTDCVHFMSIAELVEFIDESSVASDDVVAGLDLHFPAMAMCPPAVILPHENTHSHGVSISNSYARRLACQRAGV